MQKKSNNMKTPIVDFVRKYKQLKGIRFHMPGHKGKAVLGCEAGDITEISGADVLYEASGIIAESEAIAANLFGTKRTVFSTEGSSQCVRAMLELARRWWWSNQKQQGIEHFVTDSKIAIRNIPEGNDQRQERPIIIAARNVHKSFLYASILLDFEIVWLWPEEEEASLCSCTVSVKQVEEVLQAQKDTVAAVYITSPNYLGTEADIEGIAKVCHTNGTLLLVDNAHGAYLQFLKSSRHPMELGADICCDSAHKTLPVLTGGAYLHISRNAPEGLDKQAKQAMELFGSTSPSYLILQSLDLCNAYIADGYREKLCHTILQIEDTKRQLKEHGWQVVETDPLRITIKVSPYMTGEELGNILRNYNMECEYADKDYLVLMVTPENKAEDLKQFLAVLKEESPSFSMKEKKIPVLKSAQKIMSVREAFFSLGEVVEVEHGIGKICRMPTAICPPAIPIVVPGERIDEAAVKCFQYYGIEFVDVIKSIE